MQALITLRQVAELTACMKDIPMADNMQDVLTAGQEEGEGGLSGTSSNNKPPGNADGQS